MRPKLKLKQQDEDLKPWESIILSRDLNNIIKYIHNGGDVNEKFGKSGFNPIMFAASCLNVLAMIRLLQDGSNPKAKNNIGKDTMEMLQAQKKSDIFSDAIMERPIQILEEYNQIGDKLKEFADKNPYFTDAAATEFIVLCDKLIPESSILKPLEALNVYIDSEGRKFGDYLFKKFNFSEIAEIKSDTLEDQNGVLNFINNCKKLYDYLKDSDLNLISSKDLFNLILGYIEYSDIQNSLKASSSEAKMISYKPEDKKQDESEDQQKSDQESRNTKIPIMPGTNLLDSQFPVQDFKNAQIPSKKPTPSTTMIPILSSTSLSLKLKSNEKS